MPRTALRAAFLCCLPLLAGCVLPYCTPKLDYTRRIELDEMPNEVRAFRVDSQIAYNPGSYERSDRLTEIRMQGTDTIPTQWQMSVMKGLNEIRRPLCCGTPLDEFQGRSLSLRLYRPGYELVEIVSGYPTGRIVWKPAAELEAQEKALDALLPPCDADTFRRNMEPRSGPPRMFIREPEVGSVSPEHRAALLFAAGEYVRLAGLAGSPDQAAPLLNKAEALRARADQ